MPAASVANPTLSHTVTESFHLEEADGVRQETRKLSLKLYMNGSGEDRELRCELFPAFHDADVYYTCSVRRAALPELKRKFHLGEYDFDGLIRIIISQLQYSSSSSSSPSSVASSSTQSEISVTDQRPTFFCLRIENGDKCQIQVLNPGALGRQTLPFELRALRGEQLCRFFHSTLQSTTAKLNKEEKRTDRLEASLKEMRRLHKEKEAVLEATKTELEEARSLKEGLMNEVEENKIELDRLQKVEDELSDELERMELQAADHREECIDPDELRRAREEADNMRRQNVRLKDDLERSQNAVRKAEDRAAEEAKRRRNLEEQMRRLLQKEKKKVPDAPSASPLARPPPKTGGRAILGYVLAEESAKSAGSPSSEDKENDHGPPSMASSCSSSGVSSSPQKLRELEADLKEKTELLLKVMDKERTLSETLKESEQENNGCPTGTSVRNCKYAAEPRWIPVRNDWGYGRDSRDTSTLRYLTHLQPLHASSPVTLRFSEPSQPCVKHFSLRGLRISWNEKCNTGLPFAGWRALLQPDSSCAASRSLCPPQHQIIPFTSRRSESTECKRNRPRLSRQNELRSHPLKKRYLYCFYSEFPCTIQIS